MRVVLAESEIFRGNQVAKGRHRGIAFVEMETAEEAKAAIDNLNQKPNLGRILMVSKRFICSHCASALCDLPG